jgi:hypothetical protein
MNNTINLPSINDLYKQKAERIKTGAREIAGDQFLDWVIDNDKELARTIKSIHNPQRLGGLDQYIAYI